MIIYIKSSNKRKKEYRIITTIEEQNGTKIVRKRPVSVFSNNHCLSLISNYEKLKSIPISTVIVKPEVDGESVTFPFVDGEVLINEFIHLYKLGKVDQALDIIRDVRQIINEIPSEKVNLSI